MNTNAEGLWHNARLLPAGDPERALTDGAMVVRDGRIAWVGQLNALPDSYAARTGRPDDVGVLGVALFRKKREPQPVAPAAPAEPAAGARAEQRDSRLGTGHGRHEHSPAVHVTFERATVAPAEVITLYYDSHANLVARGIIREPVQVAPTLPRPFPGFVPDPRG